ncbi:uncharacterized protein LOC126742198 isoform X2 [Anthonomus grandis grandis]|uniref:uncharacterized protein LOC126742198 isoform X2 n=1 Tax=Anthonomus grandis grandis TaxID=2921223 RepID=UPI002166B853|nr:uncharacterized protein LOC126742198 isoform X2 [Anthonomus grandis grandis]
MHQMVMVNSKRWRESETIKFVQLYEQAECLWNVRHPHYKIRTAREKASLHIIEQMNMPDFGMSELKTKIKNIRSTYQQEVNKMKKSKLSLAGAVIEEYKTNLAWFPVADRFLSKVINNVFKNNQVSESNSESIGFQMEPVAYGHLQDEPEDFSSFTVNLEDIKQEIDIDEYSHDISSVQFEPEETVKKEKEGRGKKRKANGEMRSSDNGFRKSSRRVVPLRA